MSTGFPSAEESIVTAGPVIVTAVEASISIVGALNCKVVVASISNWFAVELKICSPLLAPFNSIFPVLATTKSVPSNVRFASEFIASDPVAVTILLSEPLVMKSDTSTEISLAATLIPVPSPIAKTKVPSPTVAANPAPAKFAPVTTAGVEPPTIIFPLADKSTAEIADASFPNRTPFAVSVDAPVPPFATDKSVPDQAPLFIANVPPSVKLPVVVTVPVKVNPFTVPVPPTEVAVPVVAE